VRPGQTATLSVVDGAVTVGAEGEPTPLAPVTPFAEPELNVA
jgi:hypothetical protein